MRHEWKAGDRAKCMDKGGNEHLTNGKVYDVSAVHAERGMGAGLALKRDDGRTSVYFAHRFKPVIRVQAVARPTPRWIADLPLSAETYAELRQAHGPSRYTTGEQVFKAWEPAKDRDSFDVLLGGMGKAP